MDYQVSYCNNYVDFFNAVEVYVFLNIGKNGLKFRRIQPKPFDNIFRKSKALCILKFSWSWKHFQSLHFKNLWFWFTKAEEKEINFQKKYGNRKKMAGSRTTFSNFPFFQNIFNEQNTLEECAIEKKLFFCVSFQILYVLI